MSKAASSPTARLLQSSRLFSLPRPLPQPALDTTSTGVYRASDSATTPYPTYQAIATTPSAHFRGDWGLKRSLPRKATTSSTPHIRIKAQDNQQHITDFESAADHTQTEAKWRELGVPIIIRKARNTVSDDRGLVESAYEETVDHTNPTLISSNSTFDVTASQWSSAESRTRWKHGGPWIAGMKENEFSLYVNKHIAQRKGEFQQFLRQRMLDERIQDEKRLLRERGESMVISPERQAELQQTIDDTLENEIRLLRDDHADRMTGSKLAAYICDFLDLPDATRPVQDLSIPSMNNKFVHKLTAALDIRSGPPTTHPAAGLSHLRTDAIMENHPVWGPQAQRAPVLARVLTTRNSGVRSSEKSAILGVGGIVAKDPSHARFKQELVQDPRLRYRQADSMTSKLDTQLWGGNKIWVHPTTASIDDKGRIVLEVKRGSDEAIAIKENDVQDIHRARRESYVGSTAMPALGIAGKANSRTVLPGVRSMPRVTGFDHQLGRAPAQDNVSDGAAKSSLQQLLEQSRSGVPKRQ